MQRKIIQLVTVTGNVDVSPVMYALCDDGTVWIQILHEDADLRETNWERCKNIPQE